MEGGKMEISQAAKSGDGTLENVGIKMDGKFKSPVTNQSFDTQHALDLHLKYLHDPKKAPAVDGQTADEKDLVSQDLKYYPTKVKAPAALKREDTRFVRIAAHSKGTEDDLEGIFEQASHGPLHAKDLESPSHEPDKTLTGVHSLVQYFEIMSFKTIREDDCESEASEDLHTKDLESPRHEPDKTLTGVPSLVQHFEIMSFREDDCESEASEDMSTQPEAENPTSVEDIDWLDFTTPLTSTDCSQVSTDMLGVEFEDLFLPRKPSTDSSHEGNHEIHVALEKCRAVEEGTKSYRHTNFSKYFMKGKREQARNSDDLTDAIDVMAMAIL